MEDIKHLSNPQYSQFIALSRYARWLPKENRREYWEETVSRYINYFKEKFPVIEEETWKDLHGSIYRMEVMPSMRALMTAGEALDRDNVAGFNCSFLPIEGTGETIEVSSDEILETMGEPLSFTIRNPICFDESMYILMCGAGVGFSVERQFISNLPKVGKRLTRETYKPFKKNYPGVDKDEISTYDKKTNTISVHDSKYGWSSSLRILIIELYNGNFEIEWDVSKVREKGVPLKTFGGRASGPQPLEELFHFVKEIFSKANGRKLTSLECHDIICKIGAVVVVGGVRRSACISLSNLTDGRMQSAKSGDWWMLDAQRALANNSVAYTEKPDIGIFMKEFLALYESKSGERGIFNREASEKKVMENGRRKGGYAFGTNPCSEIILRPEEFCNLSEVVVREDDTYFTLMKKVELATILGTLQSSLTNFKYLNPKWAENTKEECLLGVSLTGIMDHPVLSGSIGGDGLIYLEDGYSVAPPSFGDIGTGATLDDILRELKENSISTNQEWAERLGLNPSVAITCVKPSGTVSQLVDSASGIHARFSPYYIRTVRADKKDPLSELMISKGIPYEANVMEGQDSWVFSFPMKSPEGAIFNDDRTALDQLEHWLVYQRHWCEHKPSVTIFVKEDEWLEVGAWVYAHFDEVSGISFLPHSDHSYQQAPYQEIDEGTFLRLSEKMPKDIDWSMLSLFEKADTTAGSSTLACTGGVCEMVDLTDGGG